MRWRFLVASGVDIFEFTPERMSLEDLFVKIRERIAAYERNLDHGRNYFPRGSAPQNHVGRR